MAYLDKLQNRSFWPRSVVMHIDNQEIFLVKIIIIMIVIKTNSVWSCGLMKSIHYSILVTRGIQAACIVVRKGQNSLVRPFTPSGVFTFFRF